MEHLVIIGSGLAGYTVAREVRKLATADQCRITLVSADAGDFYSKPMLSNAFHANKSPDALVNTPREQMSQQLAIEVLPFREVLKIDREQQSVHWRDGQGKDGVTAYDALVLAVGADPIRLPLEGDAADAVLSVNHLRDYACFRAALDGLPPEQRKVVLIGAGLIGCEFANDLLGAGYAVSVFDPAPQPLGRLLPVQTAAYVRAQLAQAGADWHLGESIVAVNRGAQGLVCTTSQGQQIEAGVVLSAVGLRAKTSLAQAAGLAIGRAVSVNRHLQTSDDRIYALGDCAEVAGLYLPFVLPIMSAAKVLAANVVRQLSGANDWQTLNYPAMPVVVKTPACPVVVAPPAPQAEGQWQEHVQEQGVQAEFRAQDGRLLGFALTGQAVSQKQGLAKQLPPTLA